MILNSQITVSCDLFQLVFLEFSFHESEVVYMEIFVVFFGPVIKKKSMLHFDVMAFVNLPFPLNIPPKIRFSFSAVRETPIGFS